MKTCEFKFEAMRDDRYVFICTTCRRERVQTGPVITLKATCRDKTVSVERVVYPTEGVGAEMTKILAEIGAARDSCGSCHHHALIMNSWGPEECWRRKDEIIGWLRKAYRESSLLERLRISSMMAIRVAKLQYNIFQCPYLGIIKASLVALEQKNKS